MVQAYYSVSVIDLDKPADDVFPAGELLDSTLLGPETLALQEQLRKYVIGQDKSIDNLVSVFQEVEAGTCNPTRPVCCVLMLGPTGVGKNRTVEAVVAALHGDREHLFKVDCGEYQYGHQISKLIGSPPSYEGHKDTEFLFSQKNVDTYRSDRSDLSIILFDELEKAAAQLARLVLAIADKGFITTGRNQKVSFRRTMIFMASNEGCSGKTGSPHGMQFVHSGTKSEAVELDCCLRGLGRR